MGGGNWCIVKGCKINTKMRKGDGTNFSLFTFPKDQQRQASWLKQVNREVLTNTHARVCEIHFETHMFLNDLKNRLQPHAIPVLYLGKSSAEADQHHHE